jgi:hypothetical protein
MPGLSLKALSVGDNTRGTWTWYQWWLAVSLNTITRVSLRGGLLQDGNQMCSIPRVAHHWSDVKPTPLDLVSVGIAVSLNTIPG